MASPKTRESYQKVICGCCLLLLFINIGLNSTSFTVYQPYIVQIVGDVYGSWVLAIRTLVSLVCMLLVTRFFSLVDCRLGTFIASLLTAAAFIIYSFANSFGMFAVGAVASGIGYGLGGMVGMTLLISRWYRDHIGAAVGVATMGSGIAGIVIPLAATWVIQGFSLSMSFFVEGLLAAALAAVAFLLLRNYPDEPEVADAAAVAQADAAPVSQSGDADGAGNAGSLDGAGNAVAAGHADGAAAAAAGSSGSLDGADDLTDGANDTDDAGDLGGLGVYAMGEIDMPKPLLSNRLHALIVLGMVFMGMSAVCGQAYLSILMTSSGFDSVFAAMMLSIGCVCMTAAKAANGVVFDAIGRRRGSIVFFVLMIAGLAVCSFAFTQNVVVMVAGMVLFSIGVSLGTVGISVWSIDLSYEPERPRLAKNMQAAYAGGSFLFNLVPGLLYEATGTYCSSYAILTVLAVACCATVLVVYKKAKKS